MQTNRTHITTHNATDRIHIHMYIYMRTQFIRLTHAQRTKLNKWAFISFSFLRWVFFFHSCVVVVVVVLGVTHRHMRT